MEPALQRAHRRDQADHEAQLDRGRRDEQRHAAQPYGGEPLQPPAEQENRRQAEGQSAQQQRHGGTVPSTAEGATGLPVVIVTTDAQPVPQPAPAAARLPRARGAQCRNEHRHGAEHEQRATEHATLHARFTR